MFSIGKIYRRFSINSLSLLLEETPFQKLKRLKATQEDTFGLPWSFKGAEEAEPDLRYLADRLFIWNKIPVPKLIQEFYDMYEAVLKSLEKQTLEPVEDILEERIKSELLMRIGQMKQQGRSILLEESEHYTEEDKTPVVNIIDALMYRGLYLKRELNEPLESYHVFYDKEVGVACFTHLDLSDPRAYVNQDRIQNLHARNRLTSLQLLVSFKTPYLLHVKESDQILSKYPENYTFLQNWVFETQCEPPPKFTNESKAETYMEWMAKFKPGAWKISDMNGILLNNPLVKNKPTESS